MKHRTGFTFCLHSFKASHICAAPLACGVRAAIVEIRVLWVDKRPTFACVGSLIVARKLGIEALDYIELKIRNLQNTYLQAQTLNRPGDAISKCSRNGKA